MKDDMRLKSVTIKGANKYDFACLDDCAQSDCPCDKLKKWLSSQPKTTKVEIEWLHIPTCRTVAFWRQVVFPIALTILIAGFGLCLILTAHNIRVSDKNKGENVVRGSMETLGCRIEQKTDFETKTIDLIQIGRMLKNVRFGL